MMIYYCLYKNKTTKYNSVLGSTINKVPKFNKKRVIEVCDQSDSTYNKSKKIRFKTSMLRPDLYDYTDGYIIVKEKLLL